VSAHGYPPKRTPNAHRWMPALEFVRSDEDGPSLPRVRLTRIRQAQPRHCGRMTEPARTTELRNVLPYLLPVPFSYREQAADESSEGCRATRCLHAVALVPLTHVSWSGGPSPLLCRTTVKRSLSPDARGQSDPILSALTSHGRIMSGAVSAGCPRGARHACQARGLRRASCATANRRS
jgi:hypothetical protein